jgi:hypothetical protein
LGRVLDSVNVFEALGLAVFPKAFLETDMTRLCTYSLFKLVTSDRDLCDFCPAEIVVRQIPGFHRRLLWRGSEVELARPQRAGAASASSTAAPLPAPVLGEPVPLMDGNEGEGDDGDPGIEENDDAAEWRASVEAVADSAAAEDDRAGISAADTAPEADFVEDGGYVSDEVWGPLFRRHV